jgi:MFS family permease
MLPMFLAMSDQTIVASALPTIAGALGDVERVSWIVVAYLLAATISAPLYGYLGDSFGRRRLMFIALAMFTVGAILNSFATSMTMIAATRFIQGLGGGGLMSMSQALIGEVVPPRQPSAYPRLRWGRSPEAISPNFSAGAPCF